MNSPDPLSLRLAFDIAVTLIAFLGGWLLKTIRDDISELKQADKEVADAVNELRVALPEKYVRKEDFRTALEDISRILQRIEQKLDDKVDKP